MGRHDAAGGAAPAAGKSATSGAATPGKAATSRRIAISAGGLAVLLGALDTYVVITIIRDVMVDIQIPINQIQRVAPIITGYLVGYIAAMPLLGRASDRFGRKLLLQVSLAGFAVGSIVTALSDDLTMLVIGRIVQGTASGALLPVTLALAADLWAERKRAAVLGGIGAAQELGSVLGPLYGIAVVTALNTWRDVFWINVPMAVVAMVMIHFSVPAKQKSDAPPEKIDVVGGVLLAIVLVLVVFGLYNPAPDGERVLPEGGWILLIIAAVATVAFFVWEKIAKTKLIDPVGVHFRPFLCALGASFTAGAALMVTLVNVELFGQAVLSLDQNQAAFLLMRFLVALPVGALIGGWVASRVGDRAVAFVGLLIAAFGYWLISHWSVDLPSARHDFGLFSLPTMDVDLIVAGFGLGIVIGPLTSAALRVVPAPQHGIASSLVVVARMTGMLVGVAALSAWGLYRFNQFLQERLAAQPAPSADSPGGMMVAAAGRVAKASIEAYALQYGEIFGITMVVCIVGAVLGLFISRKDETVNHFTDDEGPAEDSTDDPATRVIRTQR